MPTTALRKLVRTFSATNLRQMWDLLCLTLACAQKYAKITALDHGDIQYLDHLGSNIINAKLVIVTLMN